MSNSTKKNKPLEKPREECFVIMPIADPDGYTTGHFGRVYSDIFVPACEKAGYLPVRADDIKQTNLIHLDVLQKLLDSPMAICDLSSRNPNVLFELGLRQAFDKPVVLVQEIGTPSIFDIAPLRYTEYRQERVYHEVLEDQKNIFNAIRATAEASTTGKGINSIVKILSLTHPAKLETPNEDGQNNVLQLVRAELNQLRNDIRHTAVNTRQLEENQFLFEKEISSRSALEFKVLTRYIDSLIDSGDFTALPTHVLPRFKNLQKVLQNLKGNYPRISNSDLIWLKAEIEFLNDHVKISKALSNDLRKVNTKNDN